MQRNEATAARLRPRRRRCPQATVQTSSWCSAASSGPFPTPTSAARGVWRLSPSGSERPGIVNPSLWRQARPDATHRLLEVTPGIYQFRGFHISNITFIQGERGHAVMDPLRASPIATATASWPIDASGTPGNFPSAVTPVPTT